MDECKKCSLALRAVVVGLIGVVGLIMCIAGGVGLKRSGTDTVEHYAEHMHEGLICMAGAFMMVISLLLPFFCVIECGDGVQKKLRIRNDYAIL
jgi:uncharacterized YccA/Bax inhibitor family protein